MPPTRKVLLFSYHFPPSTAAGARRWELLSVEGALRGFEFDVICSSENSSLPHDHKEISQYFVPTRPHWLESLRRQVIRISHLLRKNRAAEQETPLSPSTSDIPTTVSRAQLPSMISMVGLRRSINALLYYLPHLKWTQDAARLAKELAHSKSYDLIICSSPPHLTALAAARTARHARVPLVLDFRDPWSAIDVVQPDFASPFFFRFSRWLEARALKGAALLVLNTEEAMNAMRMISPGTPMLVVRNGSSNSLPVLPAHRSHRFEMVFAGAIYLDRDPRPLLHAIKLFAEKNSISNNNFGVRFIGHVSQYGNTDLNEFTRSLGIDHLVTFEKPISRARLSEVLTSASVLINLPQSARLCIPSKLYEYFEYPCWILALEEPGTATYSLLSKTGAVLCSPSDVEAISAAIGTLFSHYQEGQRPPRIADTHDVGIETQATVLFNAIDTLVLRLTPYT